MEILNNIPVKLDTDEILKHLHLQNKNNELVKNIRELISIAGKVAKPKALYKISNVDNKNGDSLYISDIKFTSRVLRVNLDKIESVFPYIVTCGKELDEIAVPTDDIMMSYCLDTIKEMVLRLARSYLNNYITKIFLTEQLSHISPGSPEVWHITQQKELFSIFGNVEDLIGVKLTESFLMLPIKSVSGIYFPSKIRFESCQLCQKDRCEDRRAPYDPDLVKKYKDKNPE